MSFVSFCFYFPILLTCVCISRKSCFVAVLFLFLMPINYLCFPSLHFLQGFLQLTSPISSVIFPLSVSVYHSYDLPVSPFSSSLSLFLPLSRQWKTVHLHREFILNPTKSETWNVLHSETETSGCFSCDPDWRRSGGGKCARNYPIID